MSTETPPPATTPEQTPVQETPPADEALREPGKRALEAERAARAAAEKALAELRTEKEEREKAELSEVERAKREAAEAQAEVQAYKSREQVAAWKAEVSKETGVPAAVLAGSTLEEIQAHAETLKPLITQAPQEPQAPLAPHVPSEGTPPSGGVASQLNANDIASMTPEQINAARRAGRLNRLMGIS